MLLQYFCERFQEIRAERGATAVEYAIMVAFIAAVIVTTVTMLGLTARGLFEPLMGCF
jgi:pilus assembly protein Flp/PilA